MKSDILRILREAPGYVSGQELCETLGVSRTAIWKAIKQLRDQGYVIEAAQNKGYHMVEAPDVIEKGEILSRLNTQWLGRNLMYQDEVDSTNTWAKRAGEDGAPNGTVTVADVQTKGKGRRGKSWITPKGTTIAMSLLLRPEFAPEQASMLTIVAGLSVAQSIREETGLKAQIKWPNDAVVSGKKVCGILTEMSAQMGYIEYVVTGIGINVNTKEFAPDIQDVATSLFIEGGRMYSRAALIARVLERFEENYGLFLKAGDLSLLREEYQKLLINCGKEIRVLDPKGHYPAISHGINEKGELLVEKMDGTRTRVFAGEVSVRGLYGYTE